MNSSFWRFRFFCTWLFAALCASTGTAWAAYYPNMSYGPERVLAPGVSWRTATNVSPAWNIHIFEIDMTERNIELVPVFRAGGNVSGASNERTSVMAERVGAVAAVNAGYFATLTNSYTLIDGQFIGGSNGDMHPENGRSVLGFSGNHQEIPKRTKLSSSFVPSDPNDWEKITDAIAGRGHFVTAGGTLVTQDNEATTASHNGNRHPRTAIGYSADPYRVWLVTVDGRQSGFSVGMTYTELGRLMADLGIEQSISLDGGGSTTAWVQGEGVVNSPSDGSERSVVSAWAVIPSNTMDNAVEEAVVSGNWGTDWAHEERYHLNYLRTTSAAGPASATWTPDLARNGTYRIYAWWTSDGNRATSVPYEIAHGFGSRTVNVSQRGNGGQWNYLGTLPFYAGTGGSVTLRNSSSGTFSADAVRFVFAEDRPSLFWSPTEWDSIGFDDFDSAEPIAFDPLVKNPADGTFGNSRWQRNFDYTTLSGPAIPVPPGGSGVALRTSANNSLPAEAQMLYRTFGSADTEDAAVEARLLGYLEDDNTSGSTTWGGIGIRMSDDFRNGYFVQHRVDDSPSFGSYLNFYRIKDGNTTLLGRYYYRIGTGGITQGTIGDSRAIRSPEESATNQWVTVRLEAVGDSVALFVDDMDEPVTIFSDFDPIAAGKAALYHEDPFGDSLTGPPGSSGTFFETFQVDVPAPPVPDWTPRVESVEFLAESGVRVEFAVPADATYEVEASADLEHWELIPGTHVADAEGSLLVEDLDAGARRFWRLREAD